MQPPSIYHLENGRYYMLVEEQSVGREMANLQLAIQMSTVKIGEIEARMSAMDDDTDEYTTLQDEMNDHQMLIADFKNRLGDLANLPVA
jgi:hypothetical protein